MNHQLDQCGYELFPDLLTQQEIAALLENLQSTTHNHNPAAAGRYAERNLLSTNPTIRELATNSRCLQLARQILGPHARAVKATFFDKNMSANWVVPPHQDMTIAVQSSIETTGFGPWTEKAGTVNVQPPASILEQMVALRFHLDDCDETNGALKVWPGSHRYGRLLDKGIEAWTSQNASTTCPVSQGGMMAIRPLIIHASSKAATPTHRRVIHIEYAACNLPNGLRWLNDLT